ncbi:arylalkylamine N-acetyltransferase 1 [Drosophila ficusphila]|uniref:arylalkylamine N-acetyltransferase 1 n=1 Tax=Drosophila ficusphila TaxID=30025 RepID=UPI0007E5DDC1|nr:arylalkylamine N-acetyltransferase 1 [Drosophila ficusphila]
MENQEREQKLENPEKLENVEPSDVEVSQVTAGEEGELMAVLLAHYYPEEPLTAGTSPPEPEAADREFLLSNVPFGTCFLARQRGKAVAAVVAGPKDAGEAEHLAEEVEKHAGGKWGRILSLLAEVERATDVCRRFGVPSSLHVHALGVDPELRGRQLGARLLAAVAQRARDLGHPLVSVDCTSAFSARLVQRLGYQLVHTLRYADFLDAGGQQVIRPPPPHECVQTFVLQL